MRRKFQRIRFIANVLILIIALPTLTFAQTTFNQIISFGASLSDPGNAFELTELQSTPPYDTLDPLLIPSAPYAKGGHHFSNGDTWIEQFARDVGLAGDANPAFLGAGTNYAVGGARARDVEERIDLPEQVDIFLADFDGVAPADALYTLEFGGNDIRDALGDMNPFAVIEGAVFSIITNISFLYDREARMFLVWNVPDVGLTPASTILDEFNPGAKVFAQYLSIYFNCRLLTELYGTSIPLYPTFITEPLYSDNGLYSELDDIEIVLFDAYGIMHELVDYPDTYGLVDTVDACVEPNSPPFQCKKPDEYLFWDGIHPTKAVHDILADYASQLLLGP